MSTILGINPGVQGMNYHDPSACIIVDGRVIAAAEEERFIRIKGAPGIFPTSSIEWCLKAASTNINALDVVAVGYDPTLWRHRVHKMLPSANHTDYRSLVASAHQLLALAEQLRISETSIHAEMYLRSELGLESAKTTVTFVPHHLAHVASSYAYCGAEVALALVADGVGENASTSILLCDRGKFQVLWEAPVEDSLGYLYAAATEMLGFSAWEGEGKVMALAAFGNSRSEIEERLWRNIQLKDGTYSLGSIFKTALSDGFALNKRRAVTILSELTGITPRSPRSELTQDHYDFARLIQDTLERIVIYLADFWVTKTKVDNVCVAGGVFLNCQLNMKLRESLGCRTLFIQPVAKDSGVALGAAIHSSLNRGQPVVSKLQMDLGPSYPRNLVRAALTQYGIRFREPVSVPDAVARYLANGLVVCWFEGGAEFGPRALGHRSILADPSKAEMRDLVNERVKKRELWRPFAASILREWCNELLENYRGQDLNMIEAAVVREPWRRKLAAVLHRDGTTRPHSVSKDKQPAFHNVLESFRKLTGIPAVLNTSFNGAGEPMVLTPEDALRSFYTSGADVLFVEGLEVFKDGTQRV